LTGNLMRELSQKDANARNNGLPNDFGIEDIHTIAAYGRDFTRRCIERSICATTKWKNHSY
jgi:hypothetical protein